MSLLEQTKLLLRKHRISPNRLLGQNFTVDLSIFGALIKYGSPELSDIVLDVGAGLGFFTRSLANKFRTVLAVEKDKTIVTALREQCRDLSNVEILEGDVRKIPIPQFDKAISIPPYIISSQLLVWLFRKKPDCAVLVLQKEFANRLIASVGNDNYGWLAVLAYYHANVRLLDDVPKSAFYPQPNVDSVIVRLKPKEPVPLIAGNEKFGKFLQALFTERNRKVKNAILTYVKAQGDTRTDEAERIVAAAHLDDRRVRHLSPEEFGIIADAILR